MNTESEHPGSAPRALVLVAFAAIYLIWGSTYLGIRFAVESLPPFLMGGVRFLVAGALLFAWLRWRGVPGPARPDWKLVLISGALLFGIGNGGVNWAEQKVSSSLAALIIAGTPIWFAVFEWLRPAGRRPTLQTVTGIVIGFVGVAVLVTGRNSGNGTGATPAGVLVLVLASMAWAAGSLYAKYAARSTSTLMIAAQQMLAGGVVLCLMGLVAGEVRSFDWKSVTARSFNAFLYLTVIGSLVGFTAYAWLLRVATPARVSTYAYVNPVIAVLLGWLLGGEQLTTPMLVAAAIIVGAVVVLTTRTNGKPPVTTATATPPPAVVAEKLI